jgi:hypothetical protein
MHRETPIRRSRFQSSLPRGAGNSNRYTVRIEFPVSYGKQTIASHSNRYARRRLSASRDAMPGRASPASRDAVPGRLPLAALRSLPGKINRKPELIEPLVSHSEQRAVLQINRKLSRPACPDVGRVRPNAGREGAAARRSNRHRFSAPTLPVSISNRNTAANRNCHNSFIQKEKTFSNRNKERVLPAQLFSSHSPLDTRHSRCHFAQC